MVLFIGVFRGCYFLCANAGTYVLFNRKKGLAQKYGCVGTYITFFFCNSCAHWFAGQHTLFKDQLRSNPLPGVIKFFESVCSQHRKKIGYQLVKPETINQLGPYLAQLLPKILGVTLNTITIISIMYFSLYFMLVNGRRMEDALYEYIPLKDGNVELIGKEVKIMVTSSTIGVLLIALLQGIVGLVGYLIIGIDEPFLWFIATCITAMLPIVGAALVYVPLTIMLFAQGDTGRGIFMAIWGFGLIGLVDNVFRFIINKKLGDIHPLVTIFGVIAGLQLFGFIGLVFGPLLISMFILLLRIYGNEFLSKRREMHRIK